MITTRKYLYLDARQWSLLGMLLFFAVVYGCISLVNHALFRTHAHDLTYYNQTIYHFSRFEFGIYNLNYTPYWHTFGDHFEPILMLLAPLRYLFGQSTLLLVQIGAVLFGAVGLYRYVDHRSENQWLPHLAAFYFLSFWGIYSALSFDFHASVLGTMFLPWLVDALERKQWKQLAIWGLLFLMCGEKLAMWGIFIALGLLWLHRRDRQIRVAGLVMAGISCVWFIVAMKFVIPSFLRAGETYRHMRFEAFGGSFDNILLHAFQHPIDTFKAFFVNHLPDHPAGDHLKGEFHKMVLLSGGLILLYRPQYLLMLLPIYASKMLNDYSAYWGINMHYSMEVIPVISLAVFGWLCKLRHWKLQYGLALLLAGLTLITTIISFSARYKPHYNRAAVDPLYPRHWSRDDCKPADLHAAVALVPEDAIVTASDALTPHLSMREKVYRFPKMGDAEYAVLMKSVDTYPFNFENHQDTLNRLRRNPHWRIEKEYEDVIVFRKRAASR